MYRCSHRSYLLLNLACYHYHHCILRLHQHRKFQVNHHLITILHHLQNSPHRQVRHRRDSPHLPSCSHHHRYRFIPS